MSPLSGDYSSREPHYLIFFYINGVLFIIIYSLRMITDKSYAKFVDDKLLCDIVKLAFIVVLDSIMKSHITEFKD